MRQKKEEAKNQSLPDYAEEKDFLSEHGLFLYEYHDQPPSGDQGLAFQVHALQIILFGLLMFEPNTIFGVVTNWVLTLHRLNLFTYFVLRILYTLMKLSFQNTISIDMTLYLVFVCV